MEENTDKTAKDTFDIGIIVRLILFVFLSGLTSTPLHIVIEGVVEGKHGAPEFITVPFLIYAFCMKLLMAFGYLQFGYKLPVKNTVLRGFAYMMLILFSSYLPNILAMAGGDGEIISSSLSVGIVLVDVLSYLLEGLILGLLMRNHAVEAHDDSHQVKRSKFLLFCTVNGVLFAALNGAFDLAFGAVNSSWRLCGLLQVSPEREIIFYRIFIVCMCIAGLLLPLWYRYCMTEDITLSRAVRFALKLVSMVWLPNVLIMVFFGTPVMPMLAYGAGYALMFVFCVIVYRKLSRLFAGAFSSVRQHGIYKHGILR